ncbi:MAG: SDR family NAD(P)-dependent oxidoreductase, partial [Exilibacterium sp.]
SAEQVYELFAATEISYGPAHRGIENLCIGVDKNNRPQALAKLALPVAVADSRDQYLLHPSVLDAALQAGIGLFIGTAGAGGESLPFALESMQVAGPCPAAGYAWVRCSPGSDPGDAMPRFDIHLCDEQGRVCITFTGFSVRLLHRRPADPVPRSQPAHSTDSDEFPDSVRATLREKTIALITAKVAATLRMAPQQLDAATPLEQYGVDSILVVRLANALSGELERVTSPLFFEHQTIGALADHFIATQAQTLRALFELSGQTGASVEAIHSAPAAPATSFIRASVAAESIVSGVDIAIIGLSGRYPQAPTLDIFWKNLKEGKNCITEIPPLRWDWREYFTEEKGQPEKIYSKWGGFIEDADKFDALFFNISPKEAEYTDPQERVFLETAYHVIEDAGYTPGNMSGSRSVGVFVGVMNSTYRRQTHFWSIANRVSYLFNFQGPSLAVDTACSSSLTAIHLALESLHSGGCECAIAGGVNLILSPLHYQGLSAASMLTAGEQCKSFGAGADGFVDGEGVGAVLLKPLARAEANGDHIYALVKGSSINAGGRTQGYTVPNPGAQRAVVIDALRRSATDPRAISYIEAHGTGTALGDPIEISALTDAFNTRLDASLPEPDAQYCAIGSAKSNIGHLESAAGIAGVTKVLLQFKHRQLAPSLHARNLNPAIDFAQTPFKVQQDLAQWQPSVLSGDGREQAFPRIAGVSSFGAGGANAHVILQEYIAAETAQHEAEAKSVLIVLSAKTEAQLKQLAKNLHAEIAEHYAAAEPQQKHALLKRIAFTLQVGREAMQERLGMVVASLESLQEKLSGFIRDNPPGDGAYRGSTRKGSDALAVFNDAEELQQAIASWVNSGRQGKLLALWVNGLVFDWRRLYGNDTPTRISLPLYPFARKSHWIATGHEKSVANANVMSLIDADENQAGSVSTFAGTMALAPVWEITKPAPHQALHAQTVLVSATEAELAYLREQYPDIRSLTLQADDSLESIKEKFEPHAGMDHLIWILPVPEAQSEIIAAQESGVILCFKAIKALLLLGYANRSLAWTVITRQTLAVTPADHTFAAHASVHGLMGSLAKEYSGWSVRVVDLEAGVERGPLLLALSLPFDAHGNLWAQRGGQWYRQQLLPCEFSDAAQRLGGRSGGVYVVIGGAGGIGEVWSEYMIRTYGAQLIWLGRRQQDDNIQARLERMAALGTVPLYIRADAADRAALQQAYTEIKSRFGAIHGLVHAAIVLQDRSLGNMDEARFRTSLAAKVNTSAHMAEVFAEETLDFVLFFSSLQSFSKAAGQSNYSAGCTFTDAFAWQLAQAWPCPVKIINWGYWGSVGVVSSDHYRKRMAAAGIGSIEPPEAMTALEQLLCGPLAQMALLKTTRPSALESAFGLQGLLLEDQFTCLPEPVQRYSDLQSARLCDSCARVPLPSVQSNREDEEALQNVLGRLLISQLQAVAVCDAQGECNEKIPSEILPLYRRWLETSFAFLARLGLFIPEPDKHYTGRLSGRVDRETAWSDWERQKERHPTLTALLKLVDSTLRELPAILTGRRPATDILFPNASMAAVEDIYKNNAPADYFNEVVAAALVAIMEERWRRDPHYRFRLLEIGAGTGGTSATVFKRLEPLRERIETYCYTDISKAFFLHAEEQFGLRVPYLKTHYFNVEKPPTEQGLTVGSFDIAIATNVLHATKNIHNTLRNAKACLKGNGFLLINELTDNSLFGHLTFALLEGWWLYEDAALRIPGCPCLYPDTWERALQQEGLSPVIFPVGKAHPLGQQVIVAQSDGLIRQGGARRGDLPFLREKVKAADAEATQQPQPDTPVMDHSIAAHVSGTIVEQLSQSLKIPREEIDTAQPFRDYGVDSITGVQLVRQINRSLGTGLETTVLYSYSTVEKLADHNLAEYRPVIAAPDAVRPPQPHSVKTLAAETAAPAAVIPEPIAVIGMSCRFAQSENPDQLWRHLANGDDLIEAVTRWDLGRLDPGFAGRGKGYCRHGSFIADIDQFDALFFNISGLEATHMDPQQRLFLEECWKAIEDAGYAGTIEGSRCGVFAGCAGSEYAQLVRAHYAAADTAEPAPPAQAFWGNAAPVLPARIAYFLDLQGPAIAIDTACSSSLVAIHMACQHLWGREIDTALAGGIMLQTTPAFYLSAGRAGMLSASGRCRSFDARADGFVPGEGAGVVMLKRLCAALADGDHLYGVIRGSGTNQDGASNGITAPSALSQARLMRRIYQTFAIQPQQIQMLEAHGTATELGDPIEYQALVKAFASGAEKTTYCALGSIKSNLGHTLLAAGVAGVIKILLALKHKKIPATLHYQSSNPAIDLNGSPFYINTRLRDWAVAPGQKRCAAVSAFGFSGTNAHLVIEEAPATNRCHTQRRGYLFVLSALEEPVLRLQVQQLLAFCETHSELDPGNLSFTLLTGRKPFEYRLATVAQDLRGLIKNLRRWYEQGRCAQVYSGRIQARDRRGQTALGQYAEQCIAQCAREPAPGDYADRLATLADLFVQGYPLDYKALFADGYSRLSLPGYPFARERYWIEPNKEPDSRTHFLTPVWEPLSAETMKQLEQNLAQNTFIPATTARVVVMGGSEQSRQALRQLYLAAQWLDLQSGAAVDDLVRQLRQAPDHIIWIPPAAPATVETLPQACEQNLIFAFRLLKALLALGCGERRFGWTIVTSLAQAVEPRAPLNPAQAGLHGLAGSMAKEYPHWNVQVIDLASESEWPLPESFALPADGQGNARAYRGGRWHRQELAPCDFSARDTAQKQGPYKSGGVYVVIGGAGGIGEVWSESVIERFKAQIVWIGRRAQDDAIEAKINRLARLGPAPYYIAADAGDPGALHRARDEILQKFSRIDGVIHSAVGTLDKSLAEMDERHFRAVLKPKVDASLCVARVFLPEYQQRPESGAPDFIVFFSSLASFAKEHGKSGYAAGSVFEDALALYLARECGSAVKVMNWGWWGSVGVAAEVPAVLRNRLQNAGIGAIKAQEAMTALALLLEGPLDQLGLINTLRGHPLADEPVVREIRPDAPGEPVQEKSFEQADAVVGHGRLREKAEHFFKRLIADTLKLPLQRVDCARPLEAYGIDSILIGRITRALSQTLRDVDSTLLFEHHSIDALIDHFMKTQPDALMRLVGWEMQTATAAIPVSPRTEVRKSSENAMPAADGKTPQPRVVGGGESIAVIGMSGRYPRAVNLDEYWENLRTGKDCITEIPAGRWPLDSFADFDPLFFNIAPREAINLDPQERLFLQSCWETLEDAGYTRESLHARHRGHVGVFAGITKTGYTLYGPELWRRGESLFPYTCFSAVANRVSYFFNFNGPSMPVDTMCSASLTAVHEACEHIKRGECSLALAGGVNLYLHPSSYIALCSQQMLSKDNKCRSFGAGGFGFVPGEGVGTVLLKPLGAAQADADRILAVILATSINHGGKTNGYTVPNPAAQSQLIKTALQKAGVNPRSIGYLEAHGTGTALGDPIEIKGLTRAFSELEQAPGLQYCALGSVKSNLGHCESAAGIAGLTKIILQMRHRQLVPSLHAETLNPEIPGSRRRITRVGRASLRSARAAPTPM